MSDEPSGSMVPADKSNWNAILKWSMAQQGDGTSGAPPAREISEEDRKWLLDAMASGFVDEIKRMKDILTCIGTGIDATHDVEEIDARVTLMEELCDRVSEEDNGGDLHTLGGVEPLVRYVASSPHARLRAAAAEVLGTTVQNHPNAQEAALGCDAMGPLLRMAAGEGTDAPPTDAATSAAGRATTVPDPTDGSTANSLGRCTTSSRTWSANPRRPRARNVARTTNSCDPSRRPSRGAGSCSATGPPTRGTPGSSARPRRRG